MCSESRGATKSVKKSIGDTIKLTCPHFGCGGSSYNFTHYNHVTGEADLIHQGTHTYNKQITSLSDAGDYCCSKQCDVDQRQCCITVEGKIVHSITTLYVTHLLCNVTAVPPVIQWTLPEAVVAGSSVTGRCRATGYPRPSVDVMNKCIDQYQHRIIDEYTSEVEFTIKNITKNCKHIHIQFI